MRSLRARAALAAALAVGALALPLAAQAGARDDDREVRALGTCTRTSQVSLRVRADDGSIRVELRIDTRRRHAAWRMILLHERRIVFRGLLRTSGSSRSIRLRRTLPDHFGRDALVVRASGPLRETCRVSATL